MPLKKLVRKARYRKLLKGDAAQRTEDLDQSRKEDVSGIRTVGIMLGPYRNLSTMTASMMSMHPQCQVLNHAGDRILGHPDVDFFSQPDRFEDFLRYAVTISQSGRRGKHGGSILHSHAFDSEHGLGAAYRSRYGDLFKKETIHCLFWKESHKVSKHLRNTTRDIGALLESNDKLRLVLPIRNPMDCANSCLNKGFLANFDHLPEEPTLIDVVTAILEEVKWVAELQRESPDKVFHYFAHSFGEATLRDIAAFLQIEPDQRWINEVVAASAIKGAYDHPPEVIEHYSSQVDRLFADFPDMKAALLRFVPA